VSHGGISAAITAGGLANPTDDDADGYGVIEYVRAWNDVAGSLTADTSIDEVIAGGVVSATLNAPVIGAVIEHDRTGFEYWDQLHPISFDSLNSVTAELQYFNGLLTDAVLDAAAATYRAMAANTAEASEELTEAIAEIAEAHSAAGLQAALLDGHLANASASAQAESERARSEIQKAIDVALTALLASETAFEKSVTHEIDDASHDAEARFTAMFQSKEDTAGVAGVLVDAAEIVKQQGEKVLDSEREKRELAADQIARDIARDSHPLEQPHTRAANWRSNAVSDGCLSSQLRDEIVEDARSMAEMFERGLLMVPILGAVYASWSLSAGENITGESLTTWDRVTLAGGLATEALLGVAGPVVGQLGDLGRFGSGNLDDIARSAGKGISTTDGLIENAGRDLAALAKNAENVAPRAGANQPGVLTRLRRFFYDNRDFRREISPEYWNVRGGANGHSLHHWLIPQRAGAPRGIQKAGFNLINLPPFRAFFTGRST
jgi:hypothetical protein